MSIHLRLSVAALDALPNVSRAATEGEERGGSVILAGLGREFARNNTGCKALAVRSVVPSEKQYLEDYAA